jgi:Secretion system C-terminal sorting domain
MEQTVSYVLLFGFVTLTKAQHTPTNINNVLLRMPQVTASNIPSSGWFQLVAHKQIEDLKLKPIQVFKVSPYAAIDIVTISQPSEQNILCLVYGECPFINIPLSADPVEAFVMPIIGTEHSGAVPPVSAFSVYPNPANTNFTVEYNLKEDVNQAEIVITDGVTGKTLVRQSLDQEKGQYSWNVTSVAPGIYYVFVKNNGKIVWQTKAFVLK